MLFGYACCLIDVFDFACLEGELFGMYIALLK